ncbi:MAG: ATP-dependent RecD-like DNA helicase [Dethiobacteraceae bacterium]|jgi:exodeoxyribonuclease V alpha subunit
MLAANPTAAQIELRGRLEKIIYNNGDYYVILLAVPEKPAVIATGSMFGVQEGDELTIWGKKVNHPTYGSQIKMERYEKAMPATKSALIDYLSSGLIKGVGPVLAKRLVETFGTDVLDIAMSEPIRLTEVKGISENKAEVISASITESIAFQQALSFLMPLGVTPKTALKAYKRWGGGTTARIQENPYCLTDLKMIGFTQADEIAQKLGIAPTSPFRIQAAILHTLRQASIRAGHCYLPTEELIRETLTMLDNQSIKRDHIAAALKNLEQTARLIFTPEYTQLAEHAIAESNIRCKIKEMLSGTSMPKNIDKAISQYEAKHKLKLAALQKEAIKQFFAHRIFILTGGPGTGKTETVRAICRIAKQLQHGIELKLAAPTGRASRRMTEVTGLHAETIHRMLGLREDDEAPLETIDADIIILDEVSMIDLFLANKLFQSINSRTKLLLVGDTDQLPSVGPGNVLKDLIKLGVPRVKLTEIFRQAEGSQIVTNAHRINQGDTKLLTGRDCHFYNIEDAAAIRSMILRLALAYKKKYSGIEGLQILSPMRRGPVGVNILNEQLQAVLNPPDPRKKEIKKHVIFREGDRVMQIVNNYEKDVFNGDVGMIESIEPNDEGDLYLTVRYPTGEVKYEQSELDELTLAYAMSIHKSQGSEYPVVIFPVTTSHYIMLKRNLIYTALTRATKSAVMIGTRKAYAIAVKNNTIQERHTRLAT